MRNVLACGIFAIGLMGCLAAPSRAAATAGDQYLAGYATAVLKVQYHLQPLRLVVHHGVARLTLPKTPPQEMAAIKKSLLAVPGIHAVSISTATKTPVPPSRSTGVSSNSAVPVEHETSKLIPASTTPPPMSQKYRLRLSPPAWQSHGDLYRLPTGYFPTGRLFEPLLADPKWPGSSAAYTHYSPYHPTSLKDVIQVSIGGTMPFFRDNLAGGWQEEGGMQADVYAYFNSDTQSKDLQNTDFFVGGYEAFRHRNLSFLLRFFHQSSHLGDEFLIANPSYYSSPGGAPGSGLRTKISYEEFNAITSLDLHRRMFRLYAGAGYLVDVGPSTLSKYIFQYGAEYHGPVLWRTAETFWNPVAGLDFKNWSQTHYDTDISARVGIQATNGRPDSSRLQFLLEFFNGHSFYGQFFVNKIQYIGFGVHFYF